MRARAYGPGLLWRRNGKWILDHRDASGRRHQWSLGTDKRVAERRRAEIIRQRDMEVDGLGANQGMLQPLRELVALYLVDLKPRVTIEHHRNVEGRLDRIVQRLGDTLIRDLKALDVIAVRNEAVTNGASNRTANLFADSIMAAIKWAVESGLIASNPIKHIKRLPDGPGHQRCRRRAMSEEEIARFLEASRQDDEENARHKTRIPQTVLWRSYLETGARWSELRLATWGDLDFNERLLVLRAENTKSRKQRVIPLREELLAEIGALRVAHQAVLGRMPTIADRIFLSPDGSPWARVSNNAMRIFDRVLEAAQIARTDVQGMKLDIHALRHSFASRLSRNGVGLVQAQRLLGHSDPKLTAVTYTHVDVEELRKAVEGIGVRAARADAAAG